jgi:hypothetical protein
MIVEKQMECRLAGETVVLGENLPQRHFRPSQNPTWPDPGLNPGCRGGKPATNRLSYSAARTYDYVLLSQIRDYLYLESQVPVLKSPRNRVAQLYPRAPGSLFVASYDFQGYGGRIRTNLHVGYAQVKFCVHLQLKRLAVSELHGVALKMETECCS